MLAWEWDETHTISKMLVLPRNALSSYAESKKQQWRQSPYKSASSHWGTWSVSH